MKFTITILSIIFLISITLKSERMDAYVLYNSKGKKIDFGDLSDKALESDVILFGELHNNPISHWLQYELTKYLADETMNKLILGAEMFESDNQQIINEYFSGLIPQKNFESEVRLWTNYKTDYKPILEFAKDNKLKFVATNIPRRYAAFVARNGLDSLEQLNDNAKKLIPALPIKYDSELPQYKKMSEMMSGAHGMAHIVEAQAVKDATMAWFIVGNFKRSYKFLHFNGAFHSDYYEGIYWYINQYKSDLKLLTITTVEQNNTSELDEENLEKADVIIVTPKSITKTH